MKKYVFLFAIFTLLLSACGASPAPQTASAPAPAPETESQPTHDSVVETSVPATETLAATETPLPATEAAAVSFSADILPILNQSCVNCHGGQFTREGLNLTSHDLLMQGSFDGPVVIPGDAANSTLIMSVASGKMPKRGSKLTAEQIQLLTEWVNAGAPNN